MADSEYPYPPDQFDREAEVATFHGAHRAEEPFWRQNLLYLAIIAAAILTLLVLLLVIGGLGKNGVDEDPATGPTQSSQAPTSDGGGEPTSAAPEPDLSTPVLIVNASGQQGLAGQWRDKLSGDGWTAVQIDTASNRQQEPVVYYRDEQDAATAQALAQAVGAGEAKQSNDYDARITFLAVDPPQG